MDSYPLAKIVLALAGIVQGAFVATGATVSPILAFAWVTAGAIVLCEVIWRWTWLKEKATTIFRIVICFVVFFAGVAMTSYLICRPNLSFGDAYLSQIGGKGERTNLSIPVHVRTRLSSSTAEILSFNKKGEKCGPGSIDPKNGCFALAIETYWSGAKCTKSLKGNQDIVPFVLVEHGSKLIFISCNDLSDLEPFKQEIPPGTYEFEVGVDDPDLRSPITRTYGFIWNGEVGGLKIK
jgi:hypothetical protein